MFYSIATVYCVSGLYIRIEWMRTSSRAITATAVTMTVAVCIFASVLSWYAVQPEEVMKTQGLHVAMKWYSRCVFGLSLSMTAMSNVCAMPFFKADSDYWVKIKMMGDYACVALPVWAISLTIAMFVFLEIIL